MNNVILKAKEANDIDLAVKKVLDDLGQREPPLDLNAVRRLLKLDIEYYRSSDVGMLREVVHSAKLGGATLLDQVKDLGATIRELAVRAILQPDRRKILIDADQNVHPKAKWRWSEAHEIAHSLIKWHGPLMKLDTMGTLSPDCLFEMETEANFGGGRLLFLRDKFSEDAHSVVPNFENILTLADRYNNTKTSTLWRFVESMDTPYMGIVGFHPTLQSESKTPTNPCRYFIRSPKFIEQFSSFSALDAVEIVEGYVTKRRGGPLGELEVIIEDDRGEEHVFHFYSWSNTHEVLTLATYKGKHAKLVAVGKPIYLN